MRIVYAKAAAGFCPDTVRFLKVAKAEGDYLVVALDVGEDKTLFKELRCVDSVIYESSLKAGEIKVETI